MRKRTLLKSLASLILAASCTSGDPIGTMPDRSVASGGLAGFEVKLDTLTEEPEIVMPGYFPSEEDKVETGTFDIDIDIDLTAPQARTEQGVEVRVGGGHVVASHGQTRGVRYIVHGSTTNGSLTILGNRKYAVVLDGACIQNPDSAALSLLSSKRAYIILSEGKTNFLRGAAQMGQRGVVDAVGKLLFSGDGKLKIHADTGHGIHSADYIVFRPGNKVTIEAAAGAGIQAETGIYINGGIFGIQVSGDAAHGLDSSCDIILSGGRVSVESTGGGTFDPITAKSKAAVCVKSEGTLLVNAGEMHLKSTGAGGKGIKANDAVINGGLIQIVTTGDQYRSFDTVSPKGIKADRHILIHGGRIWVRTAGYNGEGIEAKKNIVIDGGEVAVYARDDAINSGETTTIAGGHIYAHGRNNDGIDANGDLVVTAGHIYAIGSGWPEEALDASSELGRRVCVEGGLIVAVGGMEHGTVPTQPCYQAAAWKADTWYALSSGEETIAFQTPLSGGVPLVVSGSQRPTLLSEVSVHDGTSLFGGLAVENGTILGGTEVSLTPYPDFIKE